MKSRLSRTANWSAASSHFLQNRIQGGCGLAVTQKFIPGDLVNRLNEIPGGLDEFKQFKLLRSRLRRSISSPCPS